MMPCNDKAFEFILWSVSAVCVLSISLGLLTACGTRANSSSMTLTDMHTPLPQEILTICLDQEPESLYPVGNTSSVARSILAAVYDGPIDTNSYGYQPVILQRLPSLENGDAMMDTVSVYVGDEVVSADGLPVTLAPGIRVRPAGCRSDDCTVEYDGTAEIQMDQMVANFSLLPGLEWSDGIPVTADDSVYSFNLSADPRSSGSKFVVDRTQSYEAVDESTIQWWGKPGYIDPTYFLNFWTPYPQHLWESFAVDELPEMDEAARMPVGWGPYVITEWVSGSQITLLKNPNYFRASEALPKFNMLIFRFVSDTETAIADLIAGRCDLLDASIHLDGEVSLLASLHEQGQIQIFFSTTPIMERLDLGIQPASYDERFVLGVDRPDFFGDVLVRQALAMCIDRQKIVDTVLYGLSSVPDSYIPTEHPLHESALMSHSYDISAANQLLEQVGWQDLDGDPSTARQARGVNGVRNGTSFEITYLTTGAAQRVQVATIVAESLAQCGVKVNIQYLDNSTLYAAGPQGPLFGRTFDMAEYALGTIGLEPPCEWFTSSEIPTIENHWVGTNISGFTDLTYDSACRSARQSLPEEKGFTEAYHQTQTIFAEKIPMIPLYWRLKIAAARPDLCGFSLDPTALSSMWNIETLGYGEVCNQ